MADSDVNRAKAIA